MTHTLVQCGMCGWQEFDHPTGTDAAKAGAAHLESAHPAMAKAGGGRDQVRLFAYLTLAEYESAQATDSEPGGAESNEQEPEGEEESEEEEEEEPKPETAPKRRAPAHDKRKKRRT